MSLYRLSDEENRDSSYAGAGAGAGEETERPAAPSRWAVLNDKAGPGPDAKCAEDSEGGFAPCWLRWLRWLRCEDLRGMAGERANEEAGADADADAARVVLLKFGLLGGGDNGVEISGFRFWS